LKYGSQPTGKCIPRLRLSSLAAISGPLQPADHEIHETLHACVTEDAGTAERAEVVDDVERSGGGIRRGREGLGGVEVIG
jgi:hypothetical protein